MPTNRPLPPKDTLFRPYTPSARRVAGTRSSLIPTTPKTAPTPSSFAAIAARSGSKFHLSSINAHDQRFWLGLDTSSQCPRGEAHCARGNVTTFDGGSDALSMSVQVPGGQEVYIAQDGALGFSLAHTPPGSEAIASKGFAKSEGRLFGGLSYVDGGFFACPVEGSPTVWQIFVNISHFRQSWSCVSFDVLTVNTTGIGAWEYV